MTNKIIVECINNGNIEEVKNYKSLKELSKSYPQYEYHQLRQQVYLFTNNKTTTKKLQKNANLVNVMKIYHFDKYVVV